MDLTNATPSTTDLRITIRHLSPRQADQLAAQLSGIVGTYGGSLTLTDHATLDNGLDVKAGTRKVV